MRSSVLALCVTAGLTISVVAQGPPPPGPPPPPPPPTALLVGPTYGTGAISGIVIDGVTKQPIDGALVSLLAQGPSTPGTRPRQRTDARGRFVFTHLPAFATYGLLASRQGYFAAGFKAMPGAAISTRIALRDGEWFAKADLTMWKPAAITGTVRDERGEPVVGIAVRAIMQVPVAGRVRQATGAVAVTDDRGMYRLPNLTAGQYVVHVPSVQVTLTDGTALVGYSPPPSMGGRSGAATPPALLPLMRSEDAGGTDGLSVLVGHFPTPVPGNAASAYPMMYHPSARALDQAASVSVTYGEHRANVDVTLVLAPTVRVSGQVIGPAETIAGLPVRLMPAGSEDEGEGAEAAMTLTDPKGRFTFLRVPAGEYVAIASTTISEYSTTALGRTVMPARTDFFAGSTAGGLVAGADGLRYNSRRLERGAAAGRAAVSVGDKDVDGVAVQMVAGVTVSGHFLFDGSQSPPNGERYVPFMRLEPADGNLANGIPLASVASMRAGETPQTTATFQIKGVLPGRYMFGNEGMSLAGFTIEAMELGGQDLMTVPLEITGEKDVRDVIIRMVSKPMSLRGRVTASNGAVPEDAAVILFPAERTAWRDYGPAAARFKSVSVTAAGTFVAPAGLPGLPPGEYFAAAVRQDQRNRWTDLEFLNALSVRATRFRLTPGNPIVLDLRFDDGGR